MGKAHFEPGEQQIAQWHARVFRTALRLTGNEQDAADMTQQAFCNALGKRDRFDGRCLPTTWLHRILVNCVSDWRRRAALRSTGPLDEWDLVATDAGRSSPAGGIEDREQVERLRQVIRELPDGLRQAFVATVLDGYDYREAAELLNVPIGTVASRVSAARKRVCAAMRHAFPEV